MGSIPRSILPKPKFRRFIIETSAGTQTFIPTKKKGPADYWLIKKSGFGIESIPLESAGQIRPVSAAHSANYPASDDIKKMVIEGVKKSKIMQKQWIKPNFRGIARKLVNDSYPKVNGKDEKGLIDNVRKQISKTIHSDSPKSEAKKNFYLDDLPPNP